jgi:predicted HAD superfamily Cof-like phosphohydrolase
MQTDDAIQAVRAFHERTASPVADRPRLLPGGKVGAEALARQLLAIKAEIQADGDQLLMQRAAMAIEELAEWLQAHARGDLVAAADAWADRAYVLFGDAVAAGLPAAALFAEVHRSNMTKEPVAGRSGKAQKGRGYIRPDLEAVLNAAGSGV